MISDSVHGGRQSMIEVDWRLWADGEGDEGDEARGRVVGVSAEGMTVKLPAAYGSGALVDFEVWIAPGRCLRVLGEILGREYSRHNFCHQVAFRAMTKADRDALVSCLRTT